MQLYKDCPLPSENSGREEKGKKPKHLMYTTSYTPGKSSFTRDREKAKLTKSCGFYLGSCRRRFMYLYPTTHSTVVCKLADSLIFLRATEVWSRDDGLIVPVVASWRALLSANWEDATKLATTYKGWQCAWDCSC